MTGAQAYEVHLQGEPPKADPHIRRDEGRLAECAGPSGFQEMNFAPCERLARTAIADNCFPNMLLEPSACARRDKGILETTIRRKKFSHGKPNKKNPGEPLLQQDGLNPRQGSLLAALYLNVYVKRFISPVILLFEVIRSDGH